MASSKDKLRTDAGKAGGQTAPMVEQALAEQANNDAYGITEGGPAKRLAAAGHATQLQRDEAAAARKTAAEQGDTERARDEGKDKGRDEAPSLGEDQPRIDETQAKNDTQAKDRNPGKARVKDDEDDDEAKGKTGKDARHTPPAGRTSPHDRQQKG